MILFSALYAGVGVDHQADRPAADHEHPDRHPRRGSSGSSATRRVALYRIRVGKQIGSAALVADGYHARTDGLTSLAVVAGAIGVALGFPSRTRSSGC